MLHSRKLYSKINRMHEKCFRIVYNGNTSLYKEFLEPDKSISVYHRNMQILETEFYRIVNGFSHDITKNLFNRN